VLDLCPICPVCQWVEHENAETALVRFSAFTM
jgi:hypothetical protein